MIDQLIAEATERVNRAIGQLARKAKEELSRSFEEQAKRDGYRFDLLTCRLLGDSVEMPYMVNGWALVRA